MASKKKASADSKLASNAVNSSQASSLKSESSSLKSHSSPLNRLMDCLKQNNKQIQRTVECSPLSKNYNQCSVSEQKNHSRSRQKITNKWSDDAQKQINKRKAKKNLKNNADDEQNKQEKQEFKEKEIVAIPQVSLQQSKKQEKNKSDKINIISQESLKIKGNSNPLINQEKLQQIPDQQKKKQYYKTRLCPNFPKGNCWRGQNCDFAHSQAQIRRKKSHFRFKSEYCHRFQRGCCPNKKEQCKFAHGYDDLNIDDQLKNKQRKERLQVGQGARKSAERSINDNNNLKESKKSTSNIHYEGWGLEKNEANHNEKIKASVQEKHQPSFAEVNSSYSFQNKHQPMHTYPLCPPYPFYSPPEGQFRPQQGYVPPPSFFYPGQASRNPYMPSMPPPYPYPRPNQKQFYQSANIPNYFMNYPMVHGPPYYPIYGYINFMPPSMDARNRPQQPPQGYSPHHSPNQSFVRLDGSFEQSSKEKGARNGVQKPQGKIYDYYKH